MPLMVTSDLLQKSASDLYSGDSSVAANLYGSLKRVSNVAQQTVNMAEADATSLLSSVQSDVANLVQNGISPQGLTAGSISSALESVGQALEKSPQLAAAGQFFVSVGSGIMAGAAAGALGGPIGAAIGGIVGGVAAVISSALSEQGAHYSWPAASPGASAQLWRLQQWAKAHSSPAFPNDPIGWHFYDWISQSKPPRDAKNNPYNPICTAWLFGGNTGPCHLEAGTFWGPPPHSTDPAMPSVVAEMPNGTLAEAQTAVSRAPSSMLYAVQNFDPAHGYSPNPPQISGMLVTTADMGAVIIAPNFPYLYALGTVFAMLAAQASDQAIAAELLLQQRILYLNDCGGTGSCQSADQLKPLINEFLARIPASSAQPGTTATPIPVSGNATASLQQSPSGDSKLVLPVAQLSPRGAAWVDYYLGKGGLPSGAV